MGSSKTFQRRLFCIPYAALVAAMMFTSLACRAQSTPPEQQPAASWPPDSNKYPGLLAEFGKLFERVQNSSQSPAPRTESRLLPLLPPSTTFCAAFPNYGDVSNQLLNALREELKTSGVFRDWWEHGDMATAGPRVEEALAKFNQLQQYLGEEIIVSGTAEAKAPSLLIVAEVRKPDLKKFLQQTVEQLPSRSKSPLRVLDPQELAAAPDQGSAEGLVVLVRPDFVVLAANLAMLRSFNARLDQGGRDFASTPFGQRVMQEYQSGVTIVGGADLQKVLKQAPATATQSAAFRQSGFAEMKYLMWENRPVAGKAVSQLELSFNAPRHGAAAWLAKSRPLGGLEFVSPGALVAGSVVLASPAQIFDDVRGLVSLSNPNAFAALPVFEQALKLSLKDDLLNLLGGEITFELDNPNPPKPVWKAALAVKDANRLQRTLGTLVATAHFQFEQFEEGGLTHYKVRIPSQNTTTEIHYAFADGYLILGSSLPAVDEAVRLHRSGGSLARSKKFLGLLPPGRSLEASGFIYEDPLTMTALRLKQVAPGLADALAQSGRETSPLAVWVYGEDTAIREVSSNPAMDAGVILMAAAVAIPNMMRAKIAANEASAVASLRTLNSAQANYASGYPEKGFAPSLDTLARGTRGTAPQPTGIADLLTDSVTGEHCSPNGWCLWDGFRFKIAAACTQRLCKDYAVLAVPADTNAGARNFCSTSDGTIRSKPGAPLSGPLSASECKAWPPVQ
jgi:type IV pilus assembly protein PilA